MKKMTCPFCLSNQAFGMKFDKNLKPFYGCSVCSHIIFVRNKFAIASVEAWCTTLMSLDSSKIRELLSIGEKNFETYSKADDRILAWSEKNDEKFVKTGV